jgi:methionyl-tRNA formyltransferase
MGRPPLFMSKLPPAAGTGAALRVVVFGYHDIGVACLEAVLERGADVVAVVTHEDDPEEAIWFASLACAAAGRGIPVHVPEDPNTPVFVDQIRDLQPDLAFSFYYRRLLQPALLQIPRLGAINVHGSLLPKYRGRAPINWALVHGETVTGVTLHYMDQWADHGDIIAQRAVPISVEDTALTLSRKLTVAARGVVGDTYPLIASGRAPRLPQDHAAATRFGRRRPADGLIDWGSSAWRIYNLVRAVAHPFPGAFTHWGRRRVFVWEARPPRDRRHAGTPGHVLGVNASRSLDVAAGDGVLEVTRLQVDGERAVDGAEFAACASTGAATPIIFGGTGGRSR